MVRLVSPTATQIHLFRLLGYMRAYFHLPYRQTQGVVIAHASKEVSNTPHYMTINRRINRLEIKIDEKLGNDIVIALDSTGIKVGELRGMDAPQMACQKRISKDTHSS